MLFYMRMVIFHRGSTVLYFFLNFPNCFQVHCFLPLVSTHHVFRFHAITSMTTHTTHSTTHSFSFLYLVYLIIFLYPPHASQGHCPLTGHCIMDYFVFYLLYTENFVIVICTEDEVECYFESSVKI